MRIGQLSERFFFSGQIEPEHVPLLAEHGFRTIVCNRPDGEDWGQPTAQAIAAAAAEHDIEFIHIPVVSGGITPQNVLDFSKQCMDLEGRVLMYCRSGARCATLWETANAGRRGSGGPGDEA